MGMSDSGRSGGQPKPADRRTFLKIGAGVVAGAEKPPLWKYRTIAACWAGNNSSSSSTVTSLQNQLLSSTAAQLTSAQGQVTCEQRADLHPGATEQCQALS